jgi:ADP-heptose:LPS heptosyltransferase
MRILFITATRLGDAVLSTGLLSHLLAVHPDARFTIACGPVAEGVFDRMPNRDRTIVVEKQTLDRHWFSLWRQTVGTVWDLVIDLRGSALSFIIPARRRIVLRGGKRPGHKTEQLGNALGLVPPPPPVGWTAAADRARAEALLPAGAPLIGLGPTANWSGKVWPAERFVALFHALRARIPHARPVLFAGPGEAERAMAAPVLAALPDAIDLGGQLSLPEASACLARCALFVGNDSGLMHLAAAIGTPTLGLFGPTPAREYAPSGRRTAVALAEGAPGEAAMDRLPVETALHAAMELLQP